MKLSSKQVAYLKSQAHHLSPIFQIGKHGLSDEQLSQINDALEKRELVKIALLQNSFEDPKQSGQEIADYCQAQLIQVIGRTLVLFKRSRQPSNRKISLELRKR